MYVAGTSSAVRWMVLVGLGGVTAGMVLVSMRLNFLFGYSLGQTSERALVFGWISVIVDAWKALGLIAVGTLWRAQRRLTSVLALSVWLLCLLYAVSSAIGFAAEDRTTLTASRANAAQDLDALQSALTRTEAQLHALNNPRAVSVLEAAIAGTLTRAVISRDRGLGTVASLSRNCTRADSRTADACVEVARLREELARAHEAQRLEKAIAANRDQLNSIRERGASPAPHPQAEILTWMSGGALQNGVVSFGLVLLMALVLECVSAFAPVVLVAFAAATRPASRAVAPDRALSRPDEPGRALSGPVAVAPPGEVLDYLTERTRLSPQHAVPIAALHADYKQWCDRCQYPPLMSDDFTTHLEMICARPELARAISRRGETYVGIALGDGDGERGPVAA